ncbi:sigma-70 family RNA polymerase sigma factor [Microbulbifer sp. ANSA003]|uniref:sigma-70 family RNA polymerase sigma factor n=1 Tax=Microbulbifer sp. ANSA003 TaxID=3243360 RepID=UPI00404177AC
MEEDLTEKWVSLETSGLMSARNYLFEYYRSYSHTIAGLIYRKCQHLGVDLQDLLQLAELGLLDAISKYDRKKKVFFKTYASFRIKGSVMNGVSSYSERASLHSYFSGENMMEFNIDFSTRSGDSLFDSIVGATLDFGYSYLLESSWLNGETSLSDFPYDSLEGQAFFQQILDYIEKLPTINQNLIRMRYIEDKSYSDIAKAMKLSKSRVAQLHSDLLASIREHVNKQTCWNKVI